MRILCPTKLNKLLEIIKPSKQQIRANLYKRIHTRKKETALYSLSFRLFFALMKKWYLKADKIYANIFAKCWLIAIVPDSRGKCRDS